MPTDHQSASDDSSARDEMGSDDKRPSAAEEPPTALAEPGQVGPCEQAARQLLADLGTRWVSLYPNSKIRRTEGNDTDARIPKGNAEAHLPAGYIAFDVDSPEGGELLALLMQDWPDTLLLGARRGPRAIYRLPMNVATGTGELVAGLEILNRFLSPGSWYDDVYYTALELREPATLPLDAATAIAETLPPTPPSRSGKKFVVEDADHWGRARRQQRLRGALIRAAPRSGSEDALRQAEERWHDWAQEDGDKRESDLYKIALSMQRHGQEYHMFERLVRSQPIRRALKGKGNPTRWLTRQYWEPAGEEIARTPRSVGSAGGTAEWRERHGEQVLAQAWLSEACERLTVELPEGPRRESLRTLAQLHASWATVHGLPYYLNRRTMLLHLEMTSKSYMAQLMGAMEDLRLLSRVDPEARRAEAANSWMLLHNDQPLSSLILLSRVSLEAPCPDLRLLDDYTVDGLRQLARKQDDEERAAYQHRLAKKERQARERALRTRVEAARAADAAASDRIGTRPGAASDASEPAMSGGAPTHAPDASTSPQPGHPDAPPSVS